MALHRDIVCVRSVKPWPQHANTLASVGATKGRDMLEGTRLQKLHKILQSSSAFSPDTWVRFWAYFWRHSTEDRYSIVSWVFIELETMNHSIGSKWKKPSSKEVNEVQVPTSLSFKSMLFDGKAGVHLSTEKCSQNNAPCFHAGHHPPHVNNCPHLPSARHSMAWQRMLIVKTRVKCLNLA